MCRGGGLHMLYLKWFCGVQGISTDLSLFSGLFTGYHPSYHKELACKTIKTFKTIYIDNINSLDLHVPTSHASHYSISESFKHLIQLNARQQLCKKYTNVFLDIHSIPVSNI